MLRIVLSGVAGGIVFFMWGFLVHTVVHLHAGSFRALENEAEVTAHLQDTIAESGAYYFPGFRGVREMTGDERAAQWAQVQDRYEAGPSGILFLRKEGVPAMPPMIFITGFSIFLLVGVIASMTAGLAGTSLNSCVKRWFFFMSIGLIVVLFSDISAWNWWRLPHDYTLMMAVDHLIGWALAGGVMAAIMKPGTRSTDPIR